MRASERAWLTLAVGVIGYELLAKDGELMSHQVDRWLVSHPRVTTAAISLTALHLLNRLPEWCDPWSIGFKWVPRG